MGVATGHKQTGAYEPLHEKEIQSSVSLHPVSNHTLKHAITYAC